MWLLDNVNLKTSQPQRAINWWCHTSHMTQWCHMTVTWPSPNEVLPLSTWPSTPTLKLRTTEGSGPSAILSCEHKEDAYQHHIQSYGHTLTDVLIWHTDVDCVIGIHYGMRYITWSRDLSLSMGGISTYSIVLPITDWLSCTCWVTAFAVGAGANGSCSRYSITQRTS